MIGDIQRGRGGDVGHTGKRRERCGLITPSTVFSGVGLTLFLLHSYRVDTVRYEFKKRKKGERIMEEGWIENK